MDREILTIRESRVLRVMVLMGAALGLTASLQAESVVEVFPSAVRLHDAADHQRVLVRTMATDGMTVDRTSRAAYSWKNGGIAQIEDGVVRPLQDGSDTLLVEFEGSRGQIDVFVEGVGGERPLRFRHDVLPVLTKAGCNTGSCHGSARGQDGFRLSLFGFDPTGDYFRLTREHPGRRINLAQPEKSLLLEKATGSVPHTGGERFKKASDPYQTLRRWLEAGAPRDPADLPDVVSIDIFPDADTVLAADGGTQQLVVRARYADGTDRDVTPLATFITSNKQAVTVSPKGLLETGERGEAQILARFDAFTVGTPVIVVPAGAEMPDYAETDLYIDGHINAKLKRLRMPASPRCSDEVFLRRVYLDINGQLPTSEDYEQFIADDRPDKRARLVDTLLQRKEFVELWVMKWAERLQLRSTQQVSYKSMLLYYTWLQQRLSDRVPMDQIVRELLTAEGGTFRSPATNYYQLERDTLKLAENTAQVFMGPRLQCAQCHNHPFDRWTMNDYYGFAAFFAQIGRKKGEDPRETIVFNRGSGEIKHPVDERPMKPKFLGGKVPDLKNRDRRAVLADWLTAPENPFFARNLANFVWAHFFGRGIVEPVDDVRVSNPPSNPALLDALAAKLIAYEYDIRKLVRDICTSDAYQRSTQALPGNADDTRNFARGPIRRIRSEVLLDIISQATDTQDKFRGLPRGARAVQIADGNTSTYFLTTFGRAKRESPCTCEVGTSPSLSQALHLINGETIHRKISQGNVVGRLLQQDTSPEDVLRRLYVTCLSREPTADEQERLTALIDDAGDSKAALDDVFWAILNSKEFSFNH